jgi:hypothetical protein
MKGELVFSKKLVVCPNAKQDMNMSIVEKYRELFFMICV